MESFEINGCINPIVPMAGLILTLSECPDNMSGHGPVYPAVNGCYLSDFTVPRSCFTILIINK